MAAAKETRHTPFQQDGIWREELCNQCFYRLVCHMNECNHFQVLGLKDDESNKHNGTRLSADCVERKWRQTRSRSQYQHADPCSQNTQERTHTVWNFLSFSVPSPIMLLCLAGLCAALLRTWPPTVPWPRPADPGGARCSLSAHTTSSPVSQSAGESTTWENNEN